MLFADGPAITARAPMAASSRCTSGTGLVGLIGHGDAARRRGPPGRRPRSTSCWRRRCRPGRRARGRGRGARPRRRADLLAELPVGGGLAPRDHRDGVVGVGVDDRGQVHGRSVHHIGAGSRLPDRPAQGTGRSSRSPQRCPPDAGSSACVRRSRAVLLVALASAPRRPGVARPPPPHRPSSPRRRRASRRSSSAGSTASGPPRASASSRCPASSSAWPGAGPSTWSPRARSPTTRTWRPRSSGSVDEARRERRASATTSTA